MIQNKLSTAGGAQLTPGSTDSLLVCPHKVMAKALSWRPTVDTCDSNSTARSFVRLFSFCTVTGAILGSLITISLLRTEVSLASLLVAAYCYGAVGVIAGALIAAFYDMIVRGSLDAETIVD